MSKGSRGWNKLAEEFQDVWHLKGRGTVCNYPAPLPKSEAGLYLR